MRIGILKEITWMALDSLRSHKMRSFLTLLGIMIGVMTVIAMVSVVQGINRSVMRFRLDHNQQTRTWHSDWRTF